jgi:hypothetical protein
MPVKSRPASRYKPRLFIDADVLFAGCAGPSEYGASLVILRMAEITLLDAIVSQQVIDEAERNLAAKMPKVLPAFGLIVSRCLQVQPDPAKEQLSLYEGMAHPADTPILAAAHLSGCPYLVTFNLRHYQPGHPEVAVLTPGEVLMHIRDRLARL